MSEVLVLPYASYGSVLETVEGGLVFEVQVRVVDGGQLLDGLAEGVVGVEWRWDHEAAVLRRARRMDRALRAYCVGSKVGR